MKHMNVGYHSTGFQMVEHRISCKGPDTINVSSVGRTVHSYILTQESEARWYAKRTGMTSLIQSLIYDENFPNNHAEGIYEFFF